MAVKDKSRRQRLTQSPPTPGGGGRGPNKPTYKGRRLARPSSRGRHGGR